MSSRVLLGVSCAVDLFPPDSKNRTSGRLSQGISQIPQKRSPSELDGFRRVLPVYERQEEIVQTIKGNQVVLVLGETGSGKTTQVRTASSDFSCCLLNKTIYSFTIKYVT